MLRNIDLLRSVWVYLIGLLFLFHVSSALFHELTDIVHQSEEKFVHRLVNFIDGQRCRHIYWDFGANQGVQIRKLYEPYHYLNGLILPYFDKWFGPIEVDSKQLQENKFFSLETRKDVCTIGFEGNPALTKRLLDIQEVYQRIGYPVVIFPETVVHVEKMNLTLYYQAEATKSPTIPPKIPSIVHGIDIDLLIQRIHHLWVSSSHHSSFRSSNHGYHTGTSKMIAKMDIEGSEYLVLPHLLAHGSLCLFDVVVIEWHDYSASSLHSDKSAKVKELVRWFNEEKSLVKRCAFEFLELDDKSDMAKDMVPLPVAPSRDETRGSSMSSVDRQFQFVTRRL